MMILVRVGRRGFSDFVERNKDFMKKIGKYNQKFNQHQKVSEIMQGQADKYVNNLSKEEVASKFLQESKYDKQFSDFISNFNEKHKGQISLLDFSNYATSFGQLKNGPIKKSDLEVIQQFQKRKIDQRLHLLRKEKLKKSGIKKEFKSFEDDPFGQPNNELFSYTHPDAKNAQKLAEAQDQTGFPSEGSTRYKLGDLKQGPFYLKDNFVMLLLHRGVSTKVTTLNRLNYFRTLVFMGNGNGVVAYGRARSQTPEASLQKAIENCKSNLIAIPMDSRCTLPRKINKRFQDYRLILRPIPGFNSWGHPTMSIMLALAGFNHMAFKTVHTSKNVYDLCNVFFKTVTKNTTPQQMAQHQGFKVYRHQFIRPLTEKQTHRGLSY